MGAKTGEGRSHRRKRDGDNGLHGIVIGAASGSFTNEEKGNAMKTIFQSGVLAAAAVVLSAGLAVPVFARDLTVVSWGGNYQDAQDRKSVV